jgi:hypothetical protein
MAQSPPLCKLVRFASFPEVVTLGPVGELKARLREEGDSPSRKTEAELRALLELYFIDHPDNRRAWESVIASLARAEGPGRGFLISGAYGSGKSHLLAALSLLVEHPPAWEHFLRSHPWMRSFARAFGPARRLIAIEVSLDDYRGSAHSLESVVFARIEQELRRRIGDAAPALVDETAYLAAFEKLVLPQRSAPFARFLSQASERREWEQLVAEDRAAAMRLAQRFLRHEGIEIATERPRSEIVAHIRDALRTSGHTGLVLLIDELSLFLASKDKRGLDQDAAFLQFLGQQSRAMPLWVMAAAQRELEDVGDIDVHSLRQIRDRYETHHLSLAQLRTVIERKLVEKPDAHAFSAAVREACAAWAGDGHLRFRPEQLARTYPFNPLALEAFEGAAQSFLSQTRSIVQAVGRAAASGMLAGRPRALIAADAAFDLASDRLEGRPELRRFGAARHFYRENARRIAPDAAELVVAAFDALALAALSETRWMVCELADALAGSAARGDEGPPFCARIEAVLKAMRRRGVYVERISQAGDFADQYYLELSSDVGEALRRRLYEIVDALGEQDSRIFEHAAAACADAAFPLALFAEPRPQQFEWMNTMRRATVERRDLRRLRSEELSRLADTLAAPATDETGWLIIGEMSDVEGQREAWREAAGQVAGRWAQAMLAWLPRPLKAEELDALREHAALRMLAADPTAREGEHGRELARATAERLALQAAEAARIAREAYLQGEILRADGRRAEVSKVSVGDDWESLLAGAFDWPLRDLFPRFREVAPRKRLAGKQRSTFIIEQFLRAGASTPPPDSALEEALASYLEPLGLARRDASGWALSVSGSPAAEALLQALPARATSADRSDRAPESAPTAAEVARFADCAAALEKGDLGLTPEMVELVVGSLARAGRLVALDGFVKPIPFAQLGTPLSDHIAYLARALPLPAQVERGALAIAQALFGEAPRAVRGLRLDCERQGEVWARLCAWAREAAGSLPALGERLAALHSTLDQGPAQWTDSRRVLAAAQELAAAIDPQADAADGLGAVADKADLASAVTALTALDEFMREDADRMVLIWRYLNDERLHVSDGGLAALRKGLIGTLEQGEAIVGKRDEFRKQAAAFLSQYAAAYQRHHAAVYSVARFRAYADLRRSPEFRALLSLVPLALGGNRAAALEAKLRAQMERHCAGGRIAEALRRQPVCPDCGLMLGDDVALVGPDEILANCRQALARELAALRERRAQLDEALRAENDVGKARAVAAALDLPADAPAESVVECFTPPVIEWLASALRTKTVARASLSELHAFLRGKRLTREQALRVFGEWLAAHGAANDADSVEFE